VLAALALSGVSCGRTHEPPAPEVVTTKGGIEMVLVPAGEFRMGSDNGKEDEAPVREVHVDAFLMDRHEMTQANFAKLVPVNGSHFKGPDRPVEMISWGDAALYCNKRSRDEGLNPCYDEETGECNFDANGYRLPTEAEWEYACRAGTAGDYSFGGDKGQLSRHAWYADNAAKQTQPVGRKKPNPWGLYDMHGNVAEWCNDVYEKGYYKVGPARDPRGPADGPRRVLRGGAWNSAAEACRSARRVGESPGSQDACFARDAIGFRCVRRAPRNHPQE
jgi:formylglycine-generating enzyme required for sulfatase activity